MIQLRGASPRFQARGRVGRLCRKEETEHDVEMPSFEFDSTRPVVMGILNVTPDSFSDGGHAQRLCRSGGVCASDGRRRRADYRRGRRVDASGLGGSVRRRGAARACSMWCAQLAEYGLVREHRYAPCRCCARVRRSRRGNHQRRDAASAILPWSTWPRTAMRGLWSCICGGEPATMQNEPALRRRGGRGARLPERPGSHARGSRRCARAHLRRSRPWLRQNARSQTIELMRNFHEFNRLGYPDDGRRFAQKLHRLRVPASSEPARARR